MLTTKWRFVAFLLLASSWIISEAGEELLTRPRNVPQEAMWVGGPDGGVFIALRTQNRSRGIYLTKVFADSTGELLYAGKLRLVPSYPILVSTRDATLFAAWDGSALLLTDGRRMLRGR